MLALPNSWPSGLRMAIAMLLALSAWSAQAADYSGSWQYGSPKKGGVWLKTQQKGDVIAFQLEASRGAPSYNSGEIEGEFALRGNAGTFKQITDYGACEIAFVFSAKAVELKQIGSADACGFGYGVHVSGMLKRKSARAREVSVL